MTIQSLKGLVKKEIEAATEILAKGHNDIQLINHNIGKASAFKQVFDILNQLSAPELVWEQKNENVWEAHTPIYRYRIWMDDTWYYVLSGDFFKVKSSIEEANAAAQTHWNKLYFQIINL